MAAGNTTKARYARRGGSEGPAIDREGDSVSDPTGNVLALVSAAIQRVDDLMEVNKELQHEITKRQDDLRDLQFKYTTDMSNLRAQHASELAAKETQRLDSIRSVDIGAVGKASEVSAAQAIALANQTSTLAETLRTQVQQTATASANAVAAAATTSASALAQALEPILADVRALRSSQSQGVGQQEQRQESRQDQNSARGGTGNVLAMVAIGISVFVGIISLIGLMVVLFRPTSTATPVYIPVPANQTAPAPSSARPGVVYVLAGG